MLKDFHFLTNPHRFLFTLSLLLLIGVVLGISLPSNGEINSVQTGPSLTILYSGNTLEEIKPCGCTPEADFGGLLRRGTAIKEVREKAKDILVLDAGGNLKGTSPQGRLKSNLIANGLASMGYDAVIPGENDFAYGTGFFQAEGARGWLASNLRHAKMEFQEIIVKELSWGARVGVIGLVDDRLFDDPSHQGITLTPPEEFLKARLQGLLQENKIDLLILLLHVREPLGKKIFEDFPEINIVITGHTEDPDDEEIKDPIIQKGRGLFFVDNRARRLGQMEVRGIGNEKKISINHAWLPLNESTEDDPSLKPSFQRYKENVKELFLKKSEIKKKQREATPFLASDACTACHEEIVHTWKETRHAHALETLREARQSYDPECLKCHVVGFEKGGYLNDAITPDLGGVQCESCHGPGKEHSKDPSVKYGKLNEETCKECHSKARDPSFSFEPYWERIRHRE